MKKKLNTQTLNSYPSPLTLIIDFNDTGIGNQFEYLSTYISLSKHYRVNIFCPCETTRPFWKAVTKHYNAKLITDHRQLKNGLVSCRKSFLSNVEYVEYYCERTKMQSEVKDNEQILDVIGVPVTKEFLPWDKIYKNKAVPEYDVIICNGALNKKIWFKKKYPRWNDVASILKGHGLTVASVGTPSEYIHGTDDLTHLSLNDTLTAIHKSKVFASNDTGLYHAAAAIGSAGVVVFTCTNTDKNYDLDFHRTFTCIQSGVPCAPCQGSEYDLWSLPQKFINCQDWYCQNIFPISIVNEIERLI